MILSEILKAVVIQVAAEANSNEYEDLPVLQAFATMIGARVGVHVPRDEFQCFLAKSRLGIDVFQGQENGYNFVTAFEVQLNLGDGVAVEPSL
jgi:hypothetical protein